MKFAFTLILSCLSFSGWAQSSEVKSISLNTVANGNSLTLNGRNWQPKIKPYFNSSFNTNPQSITINLPDSILSNNKGDEKMCLLIKKDIYVDTDFRMPTNSEKIDLKMVYPKKRQLNP